VTVTHTSDGRPRARGLRIDLPGEPGPFNAITGVVSWVNRVNPRLARQWLLPVCAETWGGYLNDINGGRCAARIDGRGKECRPPPHRGQSAGGRLVRDRPGPRAATRHRLGHTGTTGSHFSGDIFLAFSTANVPGLASAFPVGPVGSAGQDEFGTLTFVPWGRMDDFSTAVVQSVEEAVLNALIVNGEMIGRDGHRSPRLPLERLTALLS
jgi:hypothetical protein